MPIRLPSISGKVDYQVEQLLRQIVDALNGYEGRIVPPPATTADPAVLARIASLEQSLITRASAERVLSTTGPPAPGQPGVPGSGGTGGSALGKVGAGSALPTVALPNLAYAVNDYANANPAQLTNSCQDHGGSWDFMDGVVLYLQAIDPRIGFNGKRGNTSDPSHDAISYYHGLGSPTLGSPDVYVIDIIVNHCGANPSPAWQDQTTPLAAGAWMATR